MTLPRFIFLALLRIPVIGAALDGPSDEVESVENSIRVPLHWVLNAFGRLLVGLVLLGAGGFFAFSLLFPTPREAVSTVDLTAAIYQTDDEFGEQLRSCGREQLTRWLKNVQDDPQHNRDDRRQALINRAQAAKKVGYSRMGSYRFFGISEELKLRTQLALLDLQFGQFDSEQIATLSETSKLYESIEFPQQNLEAQALKLRARLGTLLAALIEQIETTSDSESLEATAEILAKIEQVSTETTFPEDLNETLKHLSNGLRVRLGQLGKPTNVCDQLELLFVKIGNERRQRIIDEFASLNCLADLPKRLDYLETQAENQDRFSNEFVEKIERLLQIHDIGEQEFEMILSKLTDLARSGRIQMSRQLVQQVMAEIDKDKDGLSRIKDRFDRLLAQLAWVGEDVVWKDIKGLSGELANLKWNDADATIVFYQPLNSVQKLDPKMTQMVRVYNSMISRYRLQFVVVLLHESKSEEAIQTIEKLSKQIEPIHFSHLDTSSEGGKKLSAEIGSENLPYLVVLDRINRVAAMDPLPRNVVGIVKKLKSQVE